MGRWIIGGTTLVAILACGGGMDLGLPDVSATCEQVVKEGKDGWTAYADKKVLLTGKVKGSGSSVEMEGGKKGACKLAMSEALDGQDGKMAAVLCTGGSFPNFTDCSPMADFDAPDMEPEEDEEDEEDKGGKEGKSKEGKNKDGKEGKSKEGKNKGGKSKGGKNK